ncbi:methyltransferase domain-containing protein [Candidatus Dependentiae bacterium]|nr:methyltransferase domain-containing protein [Candidatus Dependentiae bacterium]
MKKREFLGNNNEDFYENFFENKNYISYRYDVGSYCTRKLLIENISKKTGNLLEIGTGISSILQDINNFNLYGIDFSKKATDFTSNLFKKIGKKANIIQGNAEKLPYPNNFFDVIISSHTLEHIKNDLNALKECSRTLKKNGELILFVPGRISGIATQKEFSNLGHYRYYNLKKFKQLEKSTNNSLKLCSIKYPHKIHNLIWNKFKKIFRYINYPIKKILKDNKGYEERKIYQKILLPILSRILNKLDNFTINSEKNLFGVEFNVLTIFKKISQF